MSAEAVDLPAPAVAPPAAAESTRRGGWAARIGPAALYVAGPILLIALWQGLFELGWIRPILLPPPTRVARAFWDLAQDGTLFKHIAVSVLRVLEGFAVAAATGLGLGLAIGLSRRVDRAADLLVQLIKPIPPIAWIPLAILWFGIGETAKIYIIFLGAFFPILVNTVDGVRQTDGRLVELAQILEVSRRRFITQLVLPGAAPAIMTGLRVGAMVAWMCVVASELIAASSGVGYLIMDARQMSQTDVVLVGMITIGVLGKGLDVALRRLEARLIPWKSTFTGR